MGREVITFQIGSFANYVGAHYWNIQDDALGLTETVAGADYGLYLDADVLFRQSAPGPHAAPQYTPRVVLLDLSGSLGGCNASAAALDAGSVSVSNTWSERTEVHRAERIPRSGFAEQLDLETDEPFEAEGANLTARPLDGGQPAASPLEQSADALQRPGGVRYWTDFLKVPLHPKSVYEVPGVWHGASELSGWAGHPDLLARAEAREEVADRIRFFAEDCDSLQGFQCMVDDLGGWGAASAEVLQMIQDEFSGSPIMLFATRAQATCSANATQVQGAMELRKWQLAEALSYTTLAPLASVYSPVAPPALHAAAPNLVWPLANAYPRSGALAAALDATTLPWRLRTPPPDGSLGRPSGACSMQALAQLLRGGGGPAAGLAALRVALPAPPLPTDPHAQAAGQDTRQSPQQQQQQQHDRRPPSGLTCGAASWTPGVSAMSEDTTAESVVLRGARCNGRFATVDQAAAALDANLLAEGVRCVRHRCVAPIPMPVPLPFPRIFGPTVTRYGDVVGGRAANGSASASADVVVSVPELTRLAATGSFREALARQRRQLDSSAGAAAGRAALAAWGIGHDEVAEAREQLADLAAGGSDQDEER